MRTVLLAACLTSWMVCLAAGQGSSTRVTGGGGGGAVNVGPTGGVKVSHETTVKLGKIRPWTSNDGKTIHAELLSWPIAGAVAAKTDIKQLKIEVVRAKKVRLRTSGKVAVVALERLSEADRTYVQELVDFHETWRRPKANASGDSRGAAAGAEEGGRGTGGGEQ